MENENKRKRGRPKKVLSQEELNRPKRPRGRPRIEREEPTGEKRPRGRPKKERNEEELNKPKRPAPKGKKPFVKKFNNTKGPKKVAPKIEGDKASVEDLKNGTEVLVLSAQNSCVRGVVAQDAQKDSVFVTLKSGLTVNLPLDRVLLPKKAK